MEINVQSVYDQARDYIDMHQKEMLARLKEWVSMESPTEDIGAVNRLVAALEEEMKKDLSVRVISFASAGSTLIAERSGTDALAPVVFIGHCDTVHPVGSLVGDMPLRLDADGKAYGPGILDMKGGIVISLYAIRALTAAGYLKRPLRLLISGDEESGHQGSQSFGLIQEQCRGAAAAFVFETGYQDNRIIIQRKGTGHFPMQSFGKAAHAGICPQDGRHAILDMAKRVELIQALNDNNRGITYNVGRISGGTVVNAVPDYCKIDIDVRYVVSDDIPQITTNLQKIANSNYVDGVSAVLGGGIQFLPMEATEKNKALFSIVRDAAVQLGYPTPYEASTGGGSDAANASAAGVPTVCSMGVQGGGPHTKEEFAVVESLFDRCKLLVRSVLLAEERSFL